MASRLNAGRGFVSATNVLLEPQVEQSKRLDLARDAARAVDGLLWLIVVNWVDIKF